MTRGAVLAGGEQRVDRVQNLSIAALEPSVPALMLLPRADDEQLIEVICVLHVTVQMPMHGAGTTADAAQLGRMGQERVGHRSRRIP